MNKVIRDGKVAIIYSPGYGAGWYTWNQEHPDMIFDPAVVDFIENDKKDELLAYATLKWPEAYLGGMDRLTIQWVPEGSAFKINEYDGNETIELKESDQWIIA